MLSLLSARAASAEIETTIDKEHAFYASGRSHYILFDFRDIFPNRTSYINVTVLNQTCEEEGILYYTPFEPSKAPFSYKSDTTSTSEGWLCFSNFCYAAINNTSSYQNRENQIVDYTAANIPQVVTFDLQGRKMELTFVYGAVFNTTAPMDITNSHYYTLAIKGPIFLPQRRTSPVTPPPLTPFPSPPSVSPELDFYESSGDEYISFGLHGFPNYTMQLSSVSIGSLQNSTLYFSPTSILSCPTGYTCQIRNESSAFRCWTTIFSEKICYSVGDIRYGLVLRATRFSYYGGVGGARFEITTKCDKTVANNTLKFLDGGTDDTSFLFTLTASTSAVCVQTFAEETVEKIASIGGKAVLWFYAALTLLLGGGVLFEFAFFGKMSVPFGSFWSELGRCIAEGWYFISCGQFLPEEAHISRAEAYGGMDYQPI